MKNILLLLCLSTLALSQNKAEENSRSAIFPFGAQQSIATELFLNNLGGNLAFAQSYTRGAMQGSKNQNLDAGQYRDLPHDRSGGRYQL